MRRMYSGSVEERVGFAIAATSDIAPAYGYWIGGRGFGGEG